MPPKYHESVRKAVEDLRHASSARGCENWAFFFLFPAVRMQLLGNLE
jgi:hypothetical protein